MDNIENLELDLSDNPYLTEMTSFSTWFNNMNNLKIITIDIRL